MRIRYDAGVDALYIRLDNSEVTESDAIKPGIVLDFNARNQVVGIEVIRFKRRMAKRDIEQLKRLVR